MGNKKTMDKNLRLEMYINLFDFSQRLAEDMGYATENIKNYEKQIASRFVSSEYAEELKDKLKNSTDFFNRKRVQLNSVERCLAFLNTEQAEVKAV